MKTSSMKLGFIGTGNMAGAIMGGIIKNQIFRPEEIIGADISPAGRERVKETYGINVTGDNREAAEKSEVLILSVKPQYYADAIAEIKDCISEDQLIITIAPGKTLAWLEEQFGESSEDRAHYAEYACSGRRGHDRCMHESICDRGRKSVCA